MVADIISLIKHILSITNSHFLFLDFPNLPQSITTEAIHFSFGTGCVFNIRFIDLDACQWLLFTSGLEDNCDEIVSWMHYKKETLLNTIVAWRKKKSYQHECSGQKEAVYTFPHATINDLLCFCYKQLSLLSFCYERRWVRINCGFGAMINGQLMKWICRIKKVWKPGEIKIVSRSLLKCKDSLKVGHIKSM